MKYKTTIHYSAEGEKTHSTGTSKTHHNLTVRRAGRLSDASAETVASKHAAKRGLRLKGVQVVFRNKVQES